MMHDQESPDFCAPFGKQVVRHGRVIYQAETPRQALELAGALNAAFAGWQRVAELEKRLAELEAWKKRGAPNEDGPILC